MRGAVYNNEIIKELLRMLLLLYVYFFVVVVRGNSERSREETSCVWVRVYIYAFCNLSGIAFQVNAFFS